MSDLIKKVGGMKRAKKIVGNVPVWASGFSIQSMDYFSGNVWVDETEFYIEDLLQAIFEYNTDNCTNILNHISPLTKVINK